MNQSQIYSLAMKAGLPADRAKVAAAVAMAESGGNEKQVTKDSDDESYGLWQINMRGSLGPTRRILYNMYSNEALLEPATNARVMSAISKQGKDWSPWGAYTNKSYQKFLGNAVSTVDVEFGSGSMAENAADAVADRVPVLDLATKAGTALEKTADWVANPQNWVRVAYVAGGLLLVWTGLQTIVLPYVSGTVGKVIGVGPGTVVRKTAKSVAARKGT